MTVTTTNALREQLLAFTFTKVFQSRGWNAPARRPFMLTVREREVTCTPIAEQGGWTVLEITAAGDGPEITAPGERAWREMVDKSVTDQIHHHVLIFINSARTEAVWQFSTTISGKRLRRERRLNAGTPIAPLVALLRGMEIPFEMLDDEGEVSITAMNDRMAQIGLYAERVSKRFYDLLAKKRKGFELFLAWVDAEKDRSWYITALLNRLMFIYFIQHKGLMKNDPAYLRHRLEECIEHGYNFYRDFFLPLCFFGFARPWGERKKYGGHFDGIPYLNGGLFLPHQIERDHGITPEAVEAGTLPAEITITNEQFVAWFDFFDSYRWTLDEDNVELEGQINPDILGFIFEKYINQKQMGAYYTKEDITGYICRNTVIPRLFDMLAATGKKGAQAVNPLPIGPHPDILNDGNGISGGEGIERYIYPAVKTQEYLPTETDREFLARQQRYEGIRQDFEDGKITAINDIITYNLDIERLALDFIAGIQDAEVLRDFYFDGLRKITVLDPTCGSGAFLFAALKILAPFYEVCVRKMQAFHAQQTGQPVELKWSKENTLSSLILHPSSFVDTPDDGRQAILDQFGAELTSIHGHHNVEYFIYKRIIVDNLFGVDIMAEAVEICKLRLFLKLIAHAEPKPKEDNLGIEPLPDVDFNILCGNTLVGFSTHEEMQRIVGSSLDFDDTMGRIDEKARAVDALTTAFRQAQTARNIHAAPGQKAALEEALRNLEHELNGYLARQYGITSQDSKEYAKWLGSHQPFHWYVEFYGIVKSGGFGVIVGNPPYVEYSSVRSEYKVHGYQTETCGNLYAYVMERSICLLASKAYIGLIVPMSITSIRDYQALRHILYKAFPVSWVTNHAIRPMSLFSGISQRVSIFLSQLNASTKDGACNLWSTRYLRNNTSLKLLFSSLSFCDISNANRVDGILPKLSNSIELSIWNKLFRKKACADLFSKYGRYDLHFKDYGETYWIFPLSFIPFLTPVKSYNVLHLDSEVNQKILVSILNSSLFYWFYAAISDCWHFGKWHMQHFPYGLDELSDSSISQLCNIHDALMSDIIGNRITRYDLRIAGDLYEYRVSKSKRIIDEIDRVLAQHYGLTDEELDFIIHYDIKYRMGRDTEGEDE